MKGSHIFAQATSLLDWDHFAKIVARHQGDKSVKQRTSYFVKYLIILSNDSNNRYPTENFM